MGSDYGVPDADKLDRRITRYKWWLVPMQVQWTPIRTVRVHYIVIIGFVPNPIRQSVIFY